MSMMSETTPSPHPDLLGGLSTPRQVAEMDTATAAGTTHGQVGSGRGRSAGSKVLLGAWPPLWSALRLRIGNLGGEGPTAARRRLHTPEHDPWMDPLHGWHLNRTPGASVRSLRVPQRHGKSSTATIARTLDPVVTAGDGRRKAIPGPVRPAPTRGQGAVVCSPLRPSSSSSSCCRYLETARLPRSAPDTAGL